MEEKLSNLNNDIFKKMLEEIYDYKYVTGVLEENSLVRKFAKENDTKVFVLEPYILSEAVKRYKKVVTLLIDTKSYEFLKF